MVDNMNFIRELVRVIIFKFYTMIVYTNIDSTRVNIPLPML